MTEENHLKLRRAKSAAVVEDIQRQEYKIRRWQPDKPCHKHRDSLFSWSSGFGDFTGFVNWAFLLLFMGGTRLFLENLLK
ncbi:diacylglycerol O-acyltransferase 1-like [Diaphorina citri]|uniref:Diacylglycerol O-acyltransferase 1-like n=1 Tax=Diaphorina citri TaxID=121845 RepID=A0A3Q0J428_DIACI|nr:diacylglycerol O-acyltransferase 1-like [Diaphorina citri]